MKLKGVNKVVLGFLTEDEECRWNENKLFTKTLRYYHLPTDLTKLAEMSGTDYCGAISRARRKVQEENPLLVDPYIKEKRMAREEEFRSEYGK